mmetsp:Transcript_12527/g.35922  ORF Transcript_12527/g.35922 Transcript_12527/m.35922 type:complete len:240 (-) Transcript_12527:87-806(-)
MLLARPFPLPEGMWPMGNLNAASASGREASPFQTSWTMPSPETTTTPWKAERSRVAAYSLASPARVVTTTVVRRPGTALQSSSTWAQSLGPVPLPLLGLTKTRRCRSAGCTGGQRAETEAAQAWASPEAKSRQMSRRRRPPEPCGQWTILTVVAPPAAPGAARTLRRSPKSSCAGRPPSLWPCLEQQEQQQAATRPAQERTSATMLLPSSSDEDRSSGTSSTPLPPRTAAAGTPARSPK